MSPPASLSLFLALIVVSALFSESRAECSNVRLPWNLCRRCVMREHNDDGSFNTTFKKDIYRLEDPLCQRQIKNYVDMNPCDTVRKRSYERQAVSQFHKERLDLFLYSTCELCCDCIPIGMVESDYEKYIDTEPEKLVSVYRGNCPAHFHYDNCKIWRNGTHFMGRRGTERDDRPEVCPMFADWIKSEDARGWVRNPMASGINNDMRRAMAQVVRLTRCTDETVWKTCLRLEKAQGRV